ncbi:MAG TPA: LamG-like jellyroll fold domain-containing protein [Polyangiaceae bacterium]
MGFCLAFSACSTNSADDAPIVERAGAGGTSSAGASGNANVSGATSSSAGTSGAQAGSGGALSNAGAGGVVSNAGNGGAGAVAGAAQGGAAGSGGSGNAYNSAVLADRPVAFWAVNMAPVNEPDLTGNGHDGVYEGTGAPPRASLPNGDPVADFDGVQQYLTVPSSAAFSIPTTGNLTWEAWLRPDVLQFPHDDGVSGYIDWMGKCESYGPTCEWEARMYDTTTKEMPNRPNRISAYVFNPSAGLGSAADWQPSDGLIMAGAWYHVVGEYTTLTQPADCTNTAASPGSIDIWVNGVKWNHSSHGQTGCMSQYNVVPKANGSALDIGTMTKESFFQGAIGKVAIYDHLLSQAQITNHYAVMTGKQPSGSCANTCSF